MARKRKVSSTQRIAGLVTLVAPAPVRRIATSRMGSLAIVFGLPLLLLTGIMSVRWENGQPRFSFNRQRAEEVGRSAVDKVEGLRETWDNDPGAPNGSRPSTAANPPFPSSPWPSSGPGYGPPPSSGYPNAPAYPNSGGWNGNPNWGNAPTTGAAPDWGQTIPASGTPNGATAPNWNNPAPSPETRPSQGPMARLRETVERWR